MASKYLPLSLDLIDEGRFVKRIEIDLAELQKKMMDFVRKRGALAIKATGELNMKIQLRCDNPDDRSFTIKAKTQMSVPHCPAAVSMAMGGDDDDADSLFVRASGSSSSHPRQGKLTTDEGEPIDPNTGEVKRK